MDDGPYRNRLAYRIDADIVAGELADEWQLLVYYRLPKMSQIEVDVVSVLALEDATRAHLVYEGAG